MENRAYGSLRDIILRRGGTMTYERSGFPHGAWVIRVGGKEATIVAGGNRSFPELDRLYVPKPEHANPSHWEDYTDDLVADAEEKLLSLLR